MERHSARHSLIAVILLVLSFVLAGAGPTAAGQAAPPLELTASAVELSLTKGLAVGLIGLYGRAAVPSDLLAWQMAQGTMAEPKEGGVVGKNAKGEDVAWAAVEAGKKAGSRTGPFRAVTFIWSSTARGRGR